MTGAAPWAVAVPLAGAAAAFLLGRPRAARAAGLVSGSATLALSAAVARQVWMEGPVRLSLAGWDAPLGIELHADGLSAAMLLVTSLLGLAIAVYATGYFPHPAGGAAGARGADAASAPRAVAARRAASEADAASGPERRVDDEADAAPAHEERTDDEANATPRGGAGGARATAGFWPLLLFAWASLNALFLSADVFNLYVALELMTLAAVALVALAEGPVALGAAIRYLLAAFLGSLVYLLGVAILYGAFHTLAFEGLAESVLPGVPAWSALALITTGLALKTALFPLHFWLPRAHASAPAPVSALLSSLVVTASFYLILRFWMYVFPAVVTPAAAHVAGALGAAAILWGSVQAIRQQHLKLMIAYSTVAQVGYLVLILPLTVAAVAGSAMAWSGGLYHAVSHAFAKAAMFMAAGSVIHSVGSDRIVGLSGIATYLPVSTYAFGIAGLTLIGLPPTGGFVGKWLLLSGAIESGQWWLAIVILVGGVLTAGYVFLVLGQELSQSQDDVTPEFRPVPRAMEYAAMALALASLLLGLRATELLELLSTGSPFAAGGGP